MEKRLPWEQSIFPSSPITDYEQATEDTQNPRQSQGRNSEIAARAVFVFSNSQSLGQNCLILQRGIARGIEH
jgi:hypothetical protein